MNFLRSFLNRVVAHVVSLELLEDLFLRDYLAGCESRRSEFLGLAEQALGICSSGRAIEIGTGPSPTLLLTLAQSFSGELFGTDPNSRSVTISQSLVKAEGRPTAEKFNFVVCAAEFLPFVNRAFDLVVSSNSLHHWREPVLGLREIGRIMKRPALTVLADFRRNITRDAVKYHQSHYSNPFLKYRVRKSVEESYLPEDVANMLRHANMVDSEVVSTRLGMIVKILAPPSFDSG